MALVNCRECGNRISSEAKICPNCGIDRPWEPRKPNVARGRLLLFGLPALVILIAIGRCAAPGEETKDTAPPVIGGPPTPKVPTPEEVRSEADFQRTLLLIAALKKSMNDPASLDVSEAYASDTAVAIEYRGKNAFGALILNYAILTADGKIASGTKPSIAALWNKHIADKALTDLTKSIRGAKRLGVY